MILFCRFSSNSLRVSSSYISSLSILGVCELGEPLVVTVVVVVVVVDVVVRTR